MEDESRNIIVSIIGILISLLIALFSLEFSIVVRIISSPYFWLVIIFGVLWFLIWRTKKFVDQIKEEFENKVTEVQKGVVIEMKNYKEEFEERFKIYDRLNKLEFEVYNGKEKSN